MMLRHVISCSLLFSFGFFCQTAFAQVNANFTVNDQDGCGLLSAAFTDLSTSDGAPINSWSWSIDGVPFSMLQNPGRLFNTPGSYTICLTVSNGTESDTECKQGYITIFPKPEPAFASNTPTTGCPPLTVNFMDQS
ncbi:MAG: PKD domain-containing protein, partial [Saprospiraceae bacterium]